jgi:hypothetical protein
VPFLAIEFEGDGPEERLGPIGTDGREDLPIRSAMLTAGQSDDSLLLILGGLFIDNGAPHAVTLVYRAGPPVDGSETHAFQPVVAEISIGGSKRIWPAGRSATAFGRAIYPDSSGLFFAPSNIVDNQSHLPDLF